MGVGQDAALAGGKRIELRVAQVGDARFCQCTVITRPGDKEDRLRRQRLQIGRSNLRAALDGFIFTSKLVDGRFPDWRRVIPRNSDKALIAGREDLRQAFARAAILSNEKFRGVRLNLQENLLRITANNPEQEEAEELLDVQYAAGEMEIGFNVSYVLDVLNTLKCDQIRISLSDSISSAIIEDFDSQDAQYVVMPMRI